MELTGTWRAHPADEALRRQFHLRGFDDAGWQDAAVPGHWADISGFEDERSILFKRSFDHEVPTDTGGRAWLELDGIFYQGDVWLDGEYLGDTEGYFVRHAFDVTDALAAGTEHEIAIEANCSPSGREGKRRSMLGVFEGGNDMVPTGNPGGIWAPARLRHTGPVRIDRLRAICTEATPTSATVSVRAMLATASSRSVHVTTEIAGTRHTAEHSIAEGLNEVEWTVEVADPDLWYPRSLGEQPLYELTVKVDSRTDETSDQHGLRIGLRSVEMKRWQLSVNGERLFLKGINMGPVTHRFANVGPEDIDRQLGRAVDAGMDLVRPYAHIAPDGLYDRADELGLLVWQDTPLLGPASNGLRGQAVRQATAMVDQLGHHPSIINWNAHVAPAPQVRETPATSPTSSTRAAMRRVAAHQLPNWTKSVLDRSIKNVFDSQDGSRHTTGYTGVQPHLPRLDGSAAHLRFGWRRGNERDLQEFAARWPAQVRFVAEFGSESIPDHPTFLEGFWPGLTAEALEQNYAYSSSSFERYVPPTDYSTLESWTHASQQYQAGLLRRQIETLRRLKYRPTAGFCVHHLDDTVPTISGSLVDSNGNHKLAYKAVRDACQPVIIVSDRLPRHLDPGDPVALDVHVVNDQREPLEGATVDASLSWPGDDHRWRFEGDVEADAVVRVGTISWIVPETPGQVTLNLRLRGPVDAVNRYDATIREPRIAALSLDD
ncbi:MAG: glycoside hydrolase family 2 protein [Acidimicrobiales bacterium]